MCPAREKDPKKSILPFGMDSVEIIAERDLDRSLKVPVGNLHCHDPDGFVGGADFFFVTTSRFRRGSTS